MTYARKGMARIIAILCSLVMTFGLLGVAPRAAFADEGRYEITVSCQVSSSDAVEGEVKETSATGSATVYSETLPTKVAFDQSSGVTHPLNSALYKLLNVSSIASYVTTDRDHDKTSSDPTKKEHPGSFTAETVGTTAYAANPIYYEVTVNADKVVHVKANYSITVKDTQPQNNVTDEETTPKLDESDIPTEIEENTDENAEAPANPEETQNEGEDTTQVENEEPAATAESEPEYAITAIPAMNGTLSVYQETAEADTTVSLAAKASEGYVLDYVTVKDEEGNTYDVVKDGEEEAGETFHFTMPAQDVTVSALFDSLYYEVVFDANGGDGTMQNQSIEFGKATALTKGAFSRDNFTFTGWNTSADGSGTSFSDEEVVTDIASQENPAITLFAQWEEDKPTPVATVTISFDANGGKGTMADQTADADTATTLNANTFTYDGFTFTGWNTAADGSGTAYADEASITTGSDVKLYAQWEKNPEPVATVTISFDANGGKGTMADQTADAGTATTLNANAFTRKGYTFKGWNTAADGSGAPYADKASVTASTDLTLYAQWEKNPAQNVTISFDANGGKGTMDKQTAKKGAQTTLNANAFTRDGYSSTGWNTKADGTGAAYSDKATAEFDVNLTLYAQWKKNPAPQTNVKVTFEANGGKGTMDKQTMKKGTETNLNANTFTRDGYTFVCWNTKADGKGTSYGDKVTMKLDNDIVLFAQWKKNATPQTDVKVTFAANGGKGTMDKQTVKKATETVLNANKYTRQGYSFTGWNTKADGKGTGYKDKASVKLDADLTLYAQWKKNTTPAKPADRRNATPRTGDPMSMVAIISVAGAGIAAIAAGRASKRK